MSTKQGCVGDLYVHVFVTHSRVTPANLYCGRLCSWW